MSGVFTASRATRWAGVVVLAPVVAGVLGMLTFVSWGIVDADLVLRYGRLVAEGYYPTLMAVATGETMVSSLDVVPLPIAWLTVLFLQSRWGQ